MLTPSQYSAIIKEAYAHGMPQGHERAILREYLQCELLTLLFEHPDSKNLACIGGTSLRLLFDLDRFSEDLDFDCFLTQKKKTAIPFQYLASTLQRRGYDVVFRKKNTQTERGGTFVFSKLLHLYELSGHTTETLKIKIDFTYQEARETEIRILNRFGFAEQIITLPLSVLCARKVYALIHRKRLQARDLYDLAWFFSRRVTPDEGTLSVIGIGSVLQVLEWIQELYRSHASQIAGYERDILPFLLDPNNVKLIRLLPSLAENVLKKDN
ncbi:nucleotidyl transferase AbiEii/AbiGii toxin family protein [Candidatus Uhrbacteria bacterium]|nr:nucleotidyl transferase AbiEii/AbiGii toxin family protein [Candidatus Uhrbacteria bacterium]